MTLSAWPVPLIIRGRVIEDTPREFPGPRGGRGFATADVAAYLDQLTLAPAGMGDLASLRFSDVVDYLDELGRRLPIADNPHLQHAYEVSRGTSMLSDAMLRGLYENLAPLFRREAVEHRARSLLGVEYLDRWVDLPVVNGAQTRARMRAFGARAVHIVAGNTPVIGPVTILHNALTRGDAIIKSPSNDPMSAVAVARTMIDMAPDHPLTRHLSVAYWKGGDGNVERALYDPRWIEKIIAWGGAASIRHILKELPPGVDLITLDPKQGLAIVDATALRTDEVLSDVATRLALDIGSMNQEACFNTRLIYLVGGGEAGDVGTARRLGALTFRKLQELPATLSEPHRAFDVELRSELEALRFVDSDYDMFGGLRNEGAIIVSRNGKPVDFAHRLGCRVANIIAVGTVEAALAPVHSAAQTVSVYPESLKQALRDRLACHGAQRIVSLGGAMMDPELVTPQDGMELLRRMCRWIVEERPAGLPTEDHS